MSLQIRRGTAAQLANITPVSGELIFTTDTQQVYVGDGTTAGGIPVAVGGSGNLTGVNINASGNISAGGNVIAGNVTATGNTTAANLFTAGVVSAAGNVRGGNVSTTGAISATGNVSGNFFIGNGSQLVGIVSSYSNANVATYLASGNSLSISITGSVSAQGNISGAFHIGNGFFLTGITSYSNAAVALFMGSGNAMTISTTGTITTTANVTGGNINTGGLISAAGNIYTGGKLYATGNLENGGNLTTGFITGSALTLVGNINAGNVNVGSNVSVTGNVAAAFYLGNASAMSGLPTAYSNVLVQQFMGSGNTFNISIVGTVNSTNASAGGNIIAGGFITATGNIYGFHMGLGDSLSAVGDVVTAGNVSATGTITSTGDHSTAGNVLATGNISATGHVFGATFHATTVCATGNVVSGNLIATGSLAVNSSNALIAIQNAGGSAVGNIGTVAKPFNTVFAQATSAQYADLAENYLGDDTYEPGTVVSFGGTHEVTMTLTDSDPRVAGVVSTNPAYHMNSGLVGNFITPVALMGRVPCQVEGTVTKGALMVSAGNGRARAESAPAVGTVIGKALEDFAGDIGTIEIVVGRV
jgi:hypothetical protein